MNKKRFKYQEKDSDLTLRQGLVEYRESHPELLKEGEVSTEAAKLFRCHDICHVVFGLDTILTDEVLADTWTMFGTDVGFKNYISYLKLDEAKDIVIGAGIAKTTFATIQSIPNIIKVFIRSRSMKKKWLWDNYDQYLDTKICEIRKEFGIKII